MSQANKSINQQQSHESSPLLNNNQSESCEVIFKRFRNKYRFHIGGAWIIAILTAAAIAYLLNYEKMDSIDPNQCTSDRDKTSTIILSLFFGAAGTITADRFYLGYVTVGIVKLLTGGLAGLWWTFDFVLVLMGVLSDVNGCILR
ncbi:hypothetical protein INT47_008996 [Mucor saturninus]|uniref:TM2 domain-containing protein n=1 Tax=Mucor saturninus TaxID=64648 RepID=A0A8H7QTC6_9FUNG|nr:hypothetical protein INT47_008996 [Mucor saturninus]